MLDDLILLFFPFGFKYVFQLYSSGFPKSYGYRYHVTLCIGQQQSFTVCRTGFWVCAVLVLSVIMCYLYYFLDRVPFHQNFHHDTGSVMQIFDVFFVVSLNMLLSKFPVIWDAMKSIWHHCNIWFWNLVMQRLFTYHICQWFRKFERKSIVNTLYNLCTMTWNRLNESPLNWIPRLPVQSGNRIPRAFILDLFLDLF